MTQANVTPYLFYIANGVLDTFAYPWRIGTAAELLVYGNGGALTNFTVTGVGNPGGGTIVFTAPPAVDTVLFLRRCTVQTQETDYINNDPFGADTHEGALDKLTRLIQDVHEELGRRPALAPTSAGALRNLTLPAPSALTVIGWNSDGSALQLYELSTLGDLIVPTVSWQGAVFTSQHATLQAAIDAVPLHGGHVYLEPGIYELADTLVLGNGDAAAWATRRGMVLSGMGMPGRSKAYEVAPVDEHTVLLRWTGGAAPMVEVRGPLQGWGVQNLYLDGAGVATDGLKIISGQHGDCKNLIIESFTGAGINLDAVGPPPGYPYNTDCLHNRFQNIRIWMDGSGYAGIQLDSSVATANADFNTFLGTWIIQRNNAGHGVVLGACDSNSFYTLHFYSDGTALSDILLKYDNPSAGGWPANNQFFHTSFGEAGVQVSGTIASGHAANALYGYIGGSPWGSLQPAVEGLVCFGYDDHQNLRLIAGANPSDPAIPVHVLVQTQAGRVVHLAPSTTDIADLGTDALRWRHLILAGQAERSVRIISGDTPVFPATDYYLEAFGQLAHIGAYLPQIGTHSYEFMVKNFSDTFNLVLYPEAGDNIDGQPTWTLVPFGGVLIRSNASNGWRVIAEYVA